jgi:mannose-6-phosphate isomerase-like protein (cupin superfamily)
MRRLSVADLPTGYSSVFAAVAPGHHVDTGGVAVVAAGERSPRHSHTTPEIFLVLEGYGAVEVDGISTDIGAGDVLVIDAGEDHHLVSSRHRPLVTVWLHLEPAG